MGTLHMPMLRFLGICSFILQWAPSDQKVPVNVAVRGIATQSSSYMGFIAPFAIDGNRQHYMSYKSCTHTNTEDSPWWSVDLLHVYKIKNVTITNRGDCCGERISGAEIHIGSSPVNNGKDNPRCAVISSMATGASVNFTCNMIGRYVSVIIPMAAKSLALCEVEVYAVPFKKVLIRIQLSSSEDLTNPVTTDTVLKKIKSTPRPSVLNIRWTKKPELQTKS